MSARKPLVAFLLLLLFAPLGAAQICSPDRLDGGPCCVQAQPDIPRLRSFTQNARNLCWRECDLEFDQVCNVRWIFPVVSTTSGFDPCAPQFGRLRIRDAAGVKWRGRIVAQYSRTWLETDTAGNTLQVWRFLVNGDLRPTALAGPSPCPVPASASVFQRVRHTGYVDLARDCATGARDHAWMLTHTCDAIEHAHQRRPRD